MTNDQRDTLAQVSGCVNSLLIGPGVKVLLTLDNEHKATQKVSQKSGRKDGDDPIAWIKKQGDGRVFYCSLGHHHFNFWDKRIAPHYLAGIQYALGDLKVDDSPSQK